MAYQSEAALEQQFIDQLNKQGYTSVSIPDYDALVENFKAQFETFNSAKLDRPLTDKEWERVMNIMLGKSVFQSAKILRDKFVLEREDGTKVYLSFFDADHTKNIFQVTNQTTVVGKYVNRYDVTILVNGLPLIQVELKRRGIDIREAVNQVMRYKKHSYNGLYHFIQLFVVSNGVDTKYFANSDRDMLHKRKIGSITEPDIQSYISYLYESGRLDKSGGLTVKTIRDVILVLRLAMEYAYKERAIPLLNWDLIEYPKELGIKKVVSLSKDQEQALIQCIYMNLNRKTAGILIALFTGVRIGELCGLQMKDISLTDKTISINKTVQRIYDKKKGESYLHIGPPKTKTSARTIPVPSLLMNIIKKFYTENPNHYFLTGKTKPTEPRTYRQFFSRFLKRNGLQKVKFHEIRHTFAVRAIEIPEFDVKSLSEILGHKNVSFTLNVYGSANLQQKVKCMNLLNDLL